MSNSKKYPSQKELYLAFLYKEGKLIRRSTNKSIGTPIKQTWGTYIVAQVNNIKYYLHRLIWIYHYHSIPPEGKIDHIDKNSLNNKIENLRCVTDRVNSHNRKDRKPTWCIKVNKNKGQDTYRAYTKVNGKLYYGPSRKELNQAQMDRDWIYHLSDDNTKVERVKELKLK